MQRSAGLVSCSLVLSFATLLAAERPAHASVPLAIYAAPTAIEYDPAPHNATKVVIHGAFMFYTNGGPYSAPACGYMYFACKPGEETMCRMQWSEIEAKIAGKLQCIGFGQIAVMGNLTLLRKEGTPPGNPDPWDNGMGTWSTQGFANCQAGIQMGCGPVPPDGGGGPRDLSMPRDLSSAAADLSSVSTPDMATPKPAPDLAAPQAKDPVAPRGCAVATRGDTMPLHVVGLLAALAFLRRRRRR